MSAAEAGRSPSSTPLGSPRDQRSWDLTLGPTSGLAEPRTRAVGGGHMGHYDGWELDNMDGREQRRCLGSNHHHARKDDALNVNKR